MAPGFPARLTRDNTSRLAVTDRQRSTVLNSSNEPVTLTVMSSGIVFLDGIQTPRLSLSEFGSKAAGLAELNRICMPVPKGVAFSKTHLQASELSEWIPELERRTGTILGDADSPLLVSVRLSPEKSTAGIIGGLLNLGLTRSIIEHQQTVGVSDWFLFDSYVTLLLQIGEQIGLNERLDYELSVILEEAGCRVRNQLDAEHQRELSDRIETMLVDEGVSFLNDAAGQVRFAINAAYQSWRKRRLPSSETLDDASVGLVVQEMVFGNRDADSCAGAYFSRSPSDGAKTLYGEFATSAQGIQFDSGLTLPIDELDEVVDDLYEQLESLSRRAELAFSDMLDMEFTVDSGTLFLMQARPGKRLPAATIQVAVDLVSEGVINERQAATRISHDDIDALLQPRIDDAMLDPDDVLAVGLPGSEGVGSGYLVATQAQASECQSRGEAYVIVLAEAGKEEWELVGHAAGVIATATGMLGYAAVYSRHYNVPCVAGASSVDVLPGEDEVIFDNQAIPLGSMLTVDGFKGRIILGEADRVYPLPSDSVALAMKWLDRDGI